MSATIGIIAKLSQVAQAYDILKRDILSCRQAPGASVSETRLIRLHPLGRAAVRSAMARLAEDGLVRKIPNRGWVVSNVTERDVHEVFELLLLLEPAAAGRAAGGRAPGGAEPDRLRKLPVDGCGAGYRPDDVDSVLAFVVADRKFHVGVAELAGNQRLARQIGRLLDEATRMLVMGLSTRDRGDEMADEHRALIAAMAGHDATLAARIMHDHVAASRDMALAALTGRRSPLVV
jgi:DNA-binding GntR family transcriptional regulator